MYVGKREDFERGRRENELEKRRHRDVNVRNDLTCFYL